MKAILLRSRSVHDPYIPGWWTEERVKAAVTVIVALALASAAFSWVGYVNRRNLESFRKMTPESFMAR